MKLFRANTVALAAGALSIVTFSTLYYLDVTRKTSTGRQEAIGTITYKMKTSQRKYASQVIWEDLDARTPVYNNDTIRTADLSEAVIKLNDGTEISLNENSMVLLSLSKNEIDLNFARGGMIARREGDADGALNTININTGKTRVSMDKGNLSLSSGKEGELNLSVNSGNAKVRTGGRVEELGVDRNVGIAGDRLYELNLKLLAPSPGGYLYGSGRTGAVNFEWEKVKPGHTVFLEVARDSSFRALAAGGRVVGNTRVFQLAEGIYYWRLRAVEAGTGKKEFSEVRWFRVVSENPTVLISPANRAVISYRTVLPIITFTWRQADQDAKYRLRVSRDGEMKDVLVNRTTGQDRLSLDNLREGTYFWNIETTMGAGKNEKKIPGDLYSFQVKKSMLLPPPELLYPTDNRNMLRALMKKQDLAFTWRKGKEIPESRFELARDRDFEKVLITEIRKNNIARPALSLNEGTYYWRVTGMSGADEITPPSTARSVNVLEKGEITLLTPENDGVVVAGDEKDGTAVSFVWQRNELRGNYRLQVADDKNFSKNMREVAASEFGATVEGLGIGEYYWRVRLPDEASGNLIMKSEERKFAVKGVLTAPELIEPGNGATLNMINRDSLYLRWRRSEGANRYRVEMFKISDGGRQRLAETVTEGEEFVLDEMGKLDLGRFMWRIQAMETKDRKVLRRSAPVTAFFQITLGAEEKKPKLTSPRLLFVK